MRVANEDILKGAASASLGANWNSEPVWLGHIANYAIQLVFSSNPNGTFKLQASCDVAKQPNPTEAVQEAAVVNWTDITGSDQAVTASGNHMWTVENAGYTWVRVVFTRTSGSGVLDKARAYVKGV